MPVIDSLVTGFFTPIEKFYLWVTSPFSNFSKRYFSLVDARDENKKLKSTIEFNKLEIIALKERLRDQTEGQILDDRFKSLGLDGVFSQVIGYDPFGRSQTVWISNGSADGILMDQPVITSQGLVGRIIKIFSHTSQVLLLVDPYFAVDVITEESRVRALVIGSGDAVSLKRYPLMTHLEFLNMGEAISSGDLLITSGLNGIYPSGLPVGNVIKIDKDEKNDSIKTAVLPVVDFTRLEQVFVLTGLQKKVSFPPSKEVPLKKKGGK